MNLDKLLEMDYNKFINTLKEIEYSKRLDLLNNEKFKNKLFLVDKKDNVSKFSLVFQIYSAKDLLSKMDLNLIFLIKERYPIDKDFYLIELKRKDQSNFEKELLNNSHLLLLLLECESFYYTDLAFSYDTLIYIISFIEQNNIDYQKSCLSNIIFMSLKETNLQEKFLQSNILDKYKVLSLTICNKEVIENYLKNNYLEIPNKILFHLICYTGIDINPNYYQNIDFFKTNILRVSIFETRKNIDLLARNIDPSYFEKLLFKMEIELLNSYDKLDNLIKIKKKDSLLYIYLENQNLVNEEVTRKVLFQVVIDLFFQDSIRNIYLNISEILRYKNNKNILSKEKLEFYKELLELFSKDSNDIIQFYQKYKDSYQVSDFYQDIAKLKKDSYQRLKDSCLKIESISYLKNQKLSNFYKTNIYELTGQKFRMLIACRSRIPRGNNDSPRNCYSLIGNENMKVFDNKNIIYGYNNFNILNIMHVLESDSDSLNQSINTTNYINRISTSDELLSSNMMNEIQIKNNALDNGEYERLYPSYIVCFDKVNEKSLEASIELKIPIIIIYSEKYKKLEYNKQLDNFGMYSTSTRDEDIIENNKKKN